MNIWEIFGISPPTGPYAAWDRESENVEDRRDWRGVQAFAQPQLVPPAPNQWVNPWLTTTEHDPNHPENQKTGAQVDYSQTQGMLPPLGEFLTGQAGEGAQATEMQQLTPEYFQRVKKYEGFYPRSYWDYGQHSVGFGTRAKYPGETISREEGERRLLEELTKAENSVKALGIPMSPQQQDALTDITYNAGPGWQNWALGQAVKAGDWARAAEIYRRTATTVNQGAQVLPGLVRRRAGEAPNLLATGGGTEMAQVPLTPAQPYFLEDPSKAPQGVVTTQNPRVGPMAGPEAATPMPMPAPAQNIPSMGAGIGGMPQPAPPGTPPEVIKGAWNNYFSSPEVQGALINMMIEATRPRWNAGSMFGDVMNAGLRTIGAAETEEERRLKEQNTLDEQELNRQSREKIAGIAADSRLEVAEARRAAALEGIELKNQLRSKTLSPKEQIQYADLVRKYENDLRKQNELAFITGGEQIPETTIRAEAEKRARDRIIAGRVLLEDGGANSAGEKDAGRPNPAPRQGSQGSVNGVSGGPGEAPETPAPVPPKVPGGAANGTPGKTVEQMKAEAESRFGVGAWERIIRNPEFRMRILRQLTPQERIKFGAQ